MGGFAAKFRGFWAERGRGEAIQRTADSAGVIGQKKFLKIFKKGVKKGEKPKNWGAKGAERANLGILYRVCGAFFRPGGSISSSIAGGTVRHQRFTPLIYRGSATGSIAYLMEASPLVRPAIL